MNIVSIQNINKQHETGEVLFQNISMQVNEGQKIALVGKNGVGKTSLLQMIGDSEKFPEIKVLKTPYIVPQHLELYEERSIAEVLGVESKLNALKAILLGSSEQKYFDELSDHWEIENDLKVALSYWGLNDIELSTPLKSLSGGEKLKIFLAGILINKPRFIILDEPTNHLDYKGRELLYRWLDESTATVMIVSHDRALLNLLTDIYELTPNGVKSYTGNYDAYIEQKGIEENALLRQFDAQKQELKRAKKIQQEMAERRQKQETRGASRTEKKSLPKIIANARKATAENTTAGLKGKHEDKINDLNEQVQELQAKIDKTKKLKLEINNSALHQGKILINAENMNYAFGEKKLWRQNLTFTFYSGDRILIKGANGSGKTTLLRLITGSYKSTIGMLKLADFDYLYLDQNYSLIDSTKTVYEQAQGFNINMPEYLVKKHLARSQFGPETWDRPCDRLSGGEKMKLALCSLLVSEKVPDILILDEPTNNLDIDSMITLSLAVQAYQGCLLLVSHDKIFIDELEIERTVDLDSFQIS